MVVENEDRWWNEKCLRIVGNLSLDEFEEVRKEAKDILRTIKVKETGKYIFKIIEDTRYGFTIEIDGLYINKNPQHHILIKNGEYKILDFLTESPHSGNHDRLGIVIISGKYIESNKVIENATIYDITPTILYLMGFPIGKDMKGKVLVEAIDTTYLKKHPIKYIETYETNKQEKPQKPIRSPIDEEKIKERMRSLGYIQ